MPHVSKKKIKKEVATELAGHFLAFLSTARTTRDASVLAHELLSQTERVMLAKRLMIVVLLVRGYRFLSIESSLGVTPQTVVRVWRDLQRGRYRRIVTYARGKSPRGKAFLDEFIRAIHIGMPPRVGPGRWKWARR